MSIDDRDVLLDSGKSLQQAIADGDLSGGGSAHIIEDEGTPQTQRATLNFIGAGVLCADAGTKTECTIAGGAGVDELSELLDVTLTAPATGAVLIKSAGNWVDGQLDLADADAITGTLPVANGGFLAAGLDAVTWSDGTNPSNIWTYAVTGTDPTMTFSNGLVDFGTPVTGTSFTADAASDGLRGYVSLDNTTTCEDPATGSTTICTIGGEPFIRDTGEAVRELLSTDGGDYGEFTCTTGTCTLDAAASVDFSMLTGTAFTPNSSAIMEVDGTAQIRATGTGLITANKLDGVGAVGINIGSADVQAVIVTTDDAGDGEVQLSADSIGPDEVWRGVTPAVPQTDGYLLTYEATGDTWAWTDPATLGGGSPDIDAVTGQANWGTAATKETNDLTISGVEVDFEAGAAEGFPRLGQSATAPAGECDAAGESGRLYYDSDQDTNGSVMVCLGAGGWKDIDDDGGAGGFTSWEIDGDNTAPQTVTDGQTVTIAGGLNGIDTVAAVTRTVTLNLDFTEVSSATLGNTNFTALTFDPAGGANNPTFTMADNSVTVTGAATFNHVDGSIPAADIGTGLTDAQVSNTLTASTITAVDAAADTTTFPILAGAATGATDPLTDPGLAYNASTNALTTAGALAISGALTGATTGTFSGDVSAATFTAGASATPNLLLVDSTTSGEGKIVVSDAAGPEATMDLQVDTGTGTLTSLIQLDGITDHIDFFGPLTLFSEATPTTDADGELAVDVDGWGTGFDAIEFFNGTASAYLVAATASDTPTNGQVPKWNTGGSITWENDTTGGGSMILDLGDDAGNDSTALAEIATTGDTNSIFTEPTADKLLIAVGNDWPKADTADDLTCTNCIGPTEISDLALATDTSGNYVSSATTSMGLLLTGTEGASLGLIDCGVNEILKSTDGTTWTCAADSTGGTPSFDAITSGTNTAAEMKISTGASLVFNTTTSGTGAMTGTDTLAGDPQLAANAITVGTTGLIFEGATGGAGNAFEGLLTAVDMTADRTWTLPNADATLLYAGGALGTPASGDATNLTGTAAGLTAGTVTTNANLTGPVTSSGNVTAIATDAITDAMVINSVTASNYMPLAGGTFANAGTAPVVVVDDEGAVRFTEEDAGGANYQALKGAAAYAADATFALNITAATCTGDGNGGTLTVNGSNEIVCDADAGGGGGVWQTTTNVANLVTATDAVTVGSATALAKLAVDGDTDAEIGLLVQGSATQSANLIVAENSGGTDQWSVSAAGATTQVGSATIGTVANAAEGGVVKLDNAASICWEDTENTDEGCITTDASEVLVLSSGFTGITVPADSISDEELDEGATFTLTGTLNVTSATLTAPDKITDAMLNTTQTFDVSWKNPVVADDVYVKVSAGAITLTALDCVTTGSTTPSAFVVTVDECTNAAATCVSSGGTVSISANVTNTQDATFTDAAIDDDDWIRFDVTSLTTAPDYAHCRLEYTR